jgi:hypothetical protein
MHARNRISGFRVRTDVPDLFELQVSESEASKRFLRLLTDDMYATTRALMRRLFSELPNPDPHFVKEFQSNGFDARVWELYLFAIREDGLWHVERPYESPDYFFSRFGEKVWIEAVIAASTQKLRDPRGADELQEFVDNGLAIRFGTPLGNKLRKQYWTLPHVAGRALVIAIADFAQAGPVRWTEQGLRRYLYGHDFIMTSKMGEPLKGETTRVKTHRYGTKTIPSGFFSIPTGENISAVVFSNEGTIDKFHRKAFDPEIDRSYRLLRHGLCPDPRPESPVPQPFVDIVGLVDERWSEGLVTFHNPNAVHPISTSFFYDTMQWWWRDGEFEVRRPSFHPFNSATIVCEPTSGEPDDDFLVRLDYLAEDILDRSQMTQEDVERQYDRQRKRQQR